MDDLLKDLVTSYADLNKAVLSLSGGGNQISGTVDLKAGDSRGISLMTDGATARPRYKDGNGTVTLLATKTDIDDIKAKLHD